jgi:hypothetical protein
MSCWVDGSEREPQDQVGARLGREFKGNGSEVDNMTKWSASITSAAKCSNLSLG